MEPSNDIPPSTPRRRPRKLIVALLVLAIAACALAAAFLAYAGDYHDADATGQAGHSRGARQRGDGYLATGDPSAETHRIYPGRRWSTRPRAAHARSGGTRLRRGRADAVQLRVLRHQCRRPGARRHPQVTDGG
ncbi:MAG: hypothetical protein ACLSVD_09300 [Eggerthellaceae bacterium]